ncbi:proline--tRNA ligase [Nanoarchaeota archaeon]
MKESTLGISVKKQDDFGEWYSQVIQKSELIDYSLVSGCMVLRPYSYRIWEFLVKFLDDEFKKRGVQNAYFPLFIPESLLNKEAKHVEGFSPEVAWVTHAGDSKLSERLAVRPTSETIMYDSYKKWIRSYNDLPLLLNQWCNVVRWEFKHPVPFLRTREFLWQEGHTAYATEKEADAEVLDIIKLYARAYEELLAVPMMIGKKSEKEKFAGANYTLSIETMLPVGKAAQAGTSHALGQNFAKAFDITFQDEKSNKQHVWQNSWGFTTRSIGLMIMMHSDDKGLVLPPRIAPVQAVIVPILFSGKPDVNKQVLKACEDAKKALKCRCEIDTRDYSPGWKFNHWEVKGVPLRIEIGPKDIKAKQVTLVRRDNGKKEQIKVKDLGKVKALLDEIQDSMFNRAKKFLKSTIVNAKSISELKKAAETGKMAYFAWCNESTCEENIKDKTGAKSINMPFEAKVSGKCVCGKDAKAMVYFAKSY